MRQNKKTTETHINQRNNEKSIFFFPFWLSIVYRERFRVAIIQSVKWKSLNFQLVLLLERLILGRMLNVLRFFYDLSPKTFLTCS